MSAHLPRLKESGIRTLINFGRDPLEAPAAYFEQYGHTFQTKIFGRQSVMTRDPEWISEVLVRQAKSFEKDETTKGLSALLGNGLVTNDGPAWLRNRKMMQPHFQPAELSDYSAVFREEAEKELSSWPNRGVLNVHQAMTRVTMRVVLRTLFGADPAQFGDFERIMSDAMRYFEGVMGSQWTLPTWMPIPTNRRFLAARRDLRARLEAIIENARRHGRADTLLARLLAAHGQEKLTTSQLVDEAITMLVAGHETSALTLCYSLYLLASNPSIQVRLQKELSECGLPQTIQECQRAGLLRNCLTECLRLYPVAWALGREPTSAVEVGNVKLDKGTQVYVHQWQAHRHPDYFERAGDFIPDRWDGDFFQSLPKHLYAPFGAGPRVCIGQHFALAEMTMILARIVQQFELVRETSLPLEFRASITARPKHPLLLRVRRW